MSVSAEYCDPIQRSNAARPHPEHGPIWAEAYAWLALFPTIFIAVNGRISTDVGPVAFRFTAMEEDSLARRVTRLGCSVLCLLLVSRRANDVLRVCRRTKLLLLLPAMAFGSVLWSQNPSHTLVDATSLLLTTLFAIYLYVRYPGERLIQFLMFVALVSLLLSMAAVVLFPSVGIDAYQQDSWRGIFSQRNNAAAVCTLFLVLGLHQQPRSTLDRLSRTIVVVLALLLIIMSGSRTGWLVTALGIGLTYTLRLISRMRSLDRVVLLMAMAVPTFLTVWFLATNLNSILGMLDKDPTLSQRTVIWAEVIPSIGKRPLTGYGYSSFWQGLNGESMHAVLTTGWMEGQAQDGYLDIMLQLGLVGLIPLIWLFIRGLVQGARALERRLCGPTLKLAIVLLVLVLVENIGESSLLLPLGIPWFLAILSLLILGSPNTEWSLA